MLLGPRLQDVTPKFVALTGRTALQPRWSLGFAQTAMGLADAPDAQAQIRGVIEKAKEHEIPLSAFHFGSGYTSIGPKRYVFTWNFSKFPEPKALMRDFAEAGVKVVANVKPCLLDDHPQYRDVAARGAFIAGAAAEAPLKSQFWDGEGAHLDFTNPLAIQWWQEGLTNALLGYGVDAGWNDNNEYGLGDDEATSAGFGEPTPLSLLRPVQALLMTRATREAQLAAKPRERPFTITRAGGPGIQRYAQTWSGDNTTGWDSAEVEFAHRSRHEPLRSVQHRPRYRRLRGADARSGIADPLDPGGRVASPLPHELLEARQRDDLAVAARRGAAGDPRGAAAPPSTDALSLQRDARGA